MYNIEKIITDLLKKANFQNSLKKITIICYEGLIKNSIYKKKEKENSDKQNRIIELLEKQNELLEKLINNKDLKEELKKD